MAKKKKREQINVVNRGGWSKYEYKEHGGDINYATRTELTRIVQRASHVANERLRALERAGEDKGAYRLAQSYLSIYKRNRFAEGNKILKKMPLGRMRSLYAELRTFLSSESSTISGLKRIRNTRYRTAVERGFNGTESEWNSLVVKYFAKANEALFSSETIYNALTNKGGMKTDYLDDVIKQDKEEKQRGGKGLDLAESLVAIAKIKAKQNKK